MGNIVKIGDVRAFDNVQCDKAHALKVLEEAAEVFGAWQDYEETREDETQSYGKPHDWTYKSSVGLLDECADVMQATVNLVAALGVSDFTPYMRACEWRNRDRERITDYREFGAYDD